MISTVVFQLQIDDSGQDQPHVGHTILFEGEERLEQEFGEFFQRERSVRYQLIANVDVALAQHPAIARAEFGGQIHQQRAQHHRGPFPVVLGYLLHDLTHLSNGRLISRLMSHNGGGVGILTRVKAGRRTAATRSAASVSASGRRK